MSSSDPLVVSRRPSRSDGRRVERKRTESRHRRGSIYLGLAGGLFAASAALLGGYFATGTREIPGASRELVRYAQTKIVDLYLGPLKDEGRALVELRRLIEGFPGTHEAEQARAALARIKTERAGG